ncbi:MAG: galactose oxidase-like domain-containing protein [Pseudomonadota bacterium]
MAHRLVTNCLRDSDGDILVIGNSEAGWARDAFWAIQDIQQHRHSYFVDGSNGNEIDIIVVNAPSGPHLRTNPDLSEANNLDELDGFMPPAWDIPIEDTQIFAIHACLIPHGAQGQLLMFGGDEHDRSLFNAGEWQNTRIYDIASNRIIDCQSPQVDLFCCGHAFLSSGHPFVGGGTELWRGHHAGAHEQPRDHWGGARESASYNLDFNWTARADMLSEPDLEGTSGGGRWYPTLITLPNGRILAVGGHPSISDRRHGAWMPEIYDPVANAWTYVGGHWIYVNWADVEVVRELRVDENGDPDLDDNGNEVFVPVRDEDNNLQELWEFPPGQERPDDNANRPVNYLYYPRIFVVPGGRVFLASPNDDYSGFYNTSTGLVVGPQIAVPENNDQRYRETNHTIVMLPLLPGDNYRPHFLMMNNTGTYRLSLPRPDGATPLEDLATENPPAWVETEPRQWNDTPPLRHHGVATLLPTGAVFFSGGINEEGESGLLDDNATLNGEIYFPAIDWANDRIIVPEDEDDETDLPSARWLTVAAASVARNYHSVALLMPNGRVVTAGSNLNGTGGGNQGGDQHKEFQMEVYSPIWFWDPARPTIDAAPDAITYGEVFHIETTARDRIQRVALMRCGTVTHAWDGDQRYVGLDFAVTDTGLRLTAPPDGSVAPPGPYMLWIIAQEDLPCRQAPFVILN